MAAAETDRLPRALTPLPDRAESVALRYAWVIVAIDPFGNESESDRETHAPYPASGSYSSGWKSARRCPAIRTRRPRRRRVTNTTGERRPDATVSGLEYVPSTRLKTGCRLTTAGAGVDVRRYCRSCFRQSLVPCAPTRAPGTGLGARRTCSDRCARPCRV